MAIDELTAMIPPPEQTAATDWAAVEAELGFELPSDYKQLVARYGVGAFDGFLWVLGPSDNRNLDLERQIVPSLWALRTFRDVGGPVPYDIDSSDSLIPWAITDNGDIFYWERSRPGGPNDWTVVLGGSRGDGWEAFDGGAVECLAAVLRGDFGRSIFPDDFPSDRPSFAGEHSGGTAGS